MTKLNGEQSWKFQLTWMHLVGFGVSSVLGVLAGSSFVWANPRQAWSVVLAGFLWTLIVAVATTIVRYVRERLRRGEWTRGLLVSFEMALPPVTIYMIAAGLMSMLAPETETMLVSGVMMSARPDWLMVVPVFYAAALAAALVIGLLYILTSPYAAHLAGKSSSDDQQTHKRRW